MLIGQSMAPEEEINFEDLDKLPKAQLVLRVVLSGELFHKAVDYPIIVQGLDKQPLRGRVRRAYHAAFDEAERETIGSYNRKFRVWFFNTGTPLQVGCRLKAIALLQRAVNFFGTI